MILVIDNYDSFTYNIIQYCLEINNSLKLDNSLELDNNLKYEKTLKVIRNDALTIKEIKKN